MDKEKLKDVLLRGKYVSPDNIKKAEEFAAKRHVSIGEYLLTQGLITKDLIGQAIAESLSISYSDLNSNKPSREQALKIPEEVARKYRVVLVKDNNKGVGIATDNPTQKDLAAALKSIFKKKKITITYSLGEDIDAVLAFYRKPLETRFASIIKSQKRIAPEIIDEILKDALSHHASDIHFEPQEKEVIVRFRIDGMLQEAGRIPKEYFENILNRVKVSSYLRIDEHFATQDGSMRYVDGETTVDLRVSIVPTLLGEKIAIRLLGQYVRSFSLADIGLTVHNQRVFEEAAKKPFGMILVTGPTGSGKTTTLYALLKTVNRPEINITTIEDPVEYRLAGVNQIQVNLETNLTFAKGLRSIVRQDPNIILVGEIRDEETADISMNAALTGHLLFSTFHANDAATAIPRLLDMNIEPFLLASTLELVIAQRLVRQICETCRRTVSLSKKDMEKYGSAVAHFFSTNSLMYQGSGCSACNFTGYQGRTAIFELIKTTAELQGLILEHPSAQQIWKLARSQGARSLFEDGVEKVKTGITTIEELMRVAVPPGGIA